MIWKVLGNIMLEMVLICDFEFKVFRLAVRNIDADPPGLAEIRVVEAKSPPMTVSI